MDIAIACQTSLMFLIMFVRKLSIDSTYTKFIGYNVSI
jgi:hypothetical protein